MAVIPFDTLGVKDGDTFYVAVDGNHPLARQFLAAIRDSVQYLRGFHLSLILFTDRINEMREYTPYTIRGVRDLLPAQGGAATLDPVVNHVMGQRQPGQKDRPKLFVFADDAITHWDVGTLVLVIEIIWFHDVRIVTVATPVGTRFAISLRAVERPTERFPVSVWLRYLHNNVVLELNTRAGGICVAHRQLHETAVDFQMVLEEFITIAHTSFHTPATLAEWNFIGHNTWQYPLVVGDETLPSDQKPV